MIKPTKNNVLLELKEKVTKSGIVIADTAKDNTNNMVLVIVEVGPEVDTLYKKGMIAHPRTAPTPLLIDGKRLTVLSEDDIIALEK